MIQPRIAPKLTEEQTRVPVPSWMRRFQESYSPNMLVGLLKALVSPTRATALEAEAGRHEGAGEHADQPGPNQVDDRGRIRGRTFEQARTQHVDAVPRGGSDRPANRNDQ